VEGETKVARKFQIDFSVVYISVGVGVVMPVEEDEYDKFRISVTLARFFLVAGNLPVVVVHSALAVLQFEYTSVRSQTRDTRATGSD
jgi:hypothetical protein